MHTRSLARAVAWFALLATGCVSERAESLEAGASPDQITGKSYRLERAYLVSVHVPSADVDKVLAAAVAAVGLDYGEYDQVAYLDAPGLEQFRPREGAKAGAQVAATSAQTTSASFSVPRDSAVLQKALDAVYTAHSYEEPVIYVREVWRTRATNPDDSNPNRWWSRVR